MEGKKSDDFEGSRGGKLSEALTWGRETCISRGGGTAFDVLFLLLLLFGGSWGFGEGGRGI